MAGSGGSSAAGRAGSGGAGDGNSPGGEGGEATSGGSAGSASGGGGSGGAAGAGGAMPSAGCGKAGLASDRYSIDVGGTMREYILAVPAGYDSSKPYRLVFAWHPLGGSAQQVAGSGSNGYYGLQSASAGQAILVSPEGTAFQGDNLGWANTNGADIEFLRAMIEHFESELCIDESRIFSTGFSFGGMMSNAVGCSGLARAIAPMAGNSQVSGCAQGDTPVAEMGFHGDHDSVVDISGGRAARDVFVERNHCTSETMPADSTWCDGVADNFQPCSCVSYQGCDAGYPVIWCEYNGDHMQAPSSGPTIWNFFAQF
jgi:poly(3-hydroxybutyrate) depolymerase